MKKFIVMLLLALTCSSFASSEADAKPKKKSCKTQIAWNSDPNHKADTIAAIDLYFPEAAEAQAIRFARRESNLGQALAGYNPCTRDDSLGPFMLNQHGALRRMWASWGFSRDELKTVDGGVRAAAFLYKKCGWGPWIKPYTCRKR